MDFAIALTLFTLPEYDTIYSSHRAALAYRYAAVQLELIDPREQNNWFTPVYFCRDLELIKQRYQDSLRMPLLSETQRLPTYDVCQDSYVFADRCLVFFARLASDRSDWPGVGEAVLAATQLRDFWRDMSIASCASECVWSRRQRLQQIRHTVGDYCFYSGYWPSPMPNIRWEY